MGISDVLFEFEIALNDELTAGFYDDDEDPIRRAIVGLLAHLRAVRMLPGLDQPPCEEWHQGSVAKPGPAARNVRLNAEVNEQPAAYQSINNRKSHIRFEKLQMLSVLENTAIGKCILKPNSCESSVRLSTPSS